MTIAYGPVVISSFRGTFRRIRATDLAQTTTPGTNKAIETIFKTGDGPPTLKIDGRQTFSASPMMITGKTDLAILSPLPTRVFSFMLIPPAV
ncbi:MAG TPA: hypothetical protein PK207_05230 [Candidatus Aminicenantes bacterium]|nr:hypothetical protein [Candidatus Aminicenantes bacterium]